MDAVAAVGRVVSMQRCLEVLTALALTAYLFPRAGCCHGISVSDMEEFDFIVVGAGSAGTVVAARLAECHFKVLLVEAGGDPPLQSLRPGLLGFLPQTRYDWNYTTENDNTNFQCHRSKTGSLTLGRMLGGGSSINYMFYVRGCPRDFIPWAEAAQDPTWDWDGVLPYFIKSEKLQDKDIFWSPQSKYHGTNGFLGVSCQKTILTKKYLESFSELGHDILLDINADRSLGYNQPCFTINEGYRQSTAYTILAPQKNNPHLLVLKETLVTKIVFDENNNAIGVEAMNGNKRIELRARKEVIVSAGGLNTPRLLMLSGIGPKDHLESLNIPVRSDLPVGMNYQDHVSVMMSFKLDESTGPVPVADPRKFPFITLTGYVALNKSQTCPDYQSITFIVPHNTTAILELCSVNFGYDYDICQKFYDASKGKNTLYVTLDLLHPKSRGRVLLRSTDPAASPVVRGGYFSDDRDLETMVDSLVDYAQVLNTTYFKTIKASMVDLELGSCKELQYWSREWWRCYARCMTSTLYHYTGTSSLGSVVDSRLRVFGVRRLRVIDASIMPKLVSGNTNAATIMIAEKGTDFIKQDHGCAPNTPCSYPTHFVSYWPYWQGFRWFKK